MNLFGTLFYKIFYGFTPLSPHALFDFINIMTYDLKGACMSTDGVQDGDNPWMIQVVINTINITKRIFK